MDKETLTLLHDGLRHIKGFVGVLDRWVALQKSKDPSATDKKNKKEGYDFGEP